MCNKGPFQVSQLHRDLDLYYSRMPVGRPILNRTIFQETKHSATSVVVWFSLLQEANMVGGCTVLVTGGAGFLGQHVVGLLQEHTQHITEIRVLDMVPYENKLGNI